MNKRLIITYLLITALFLSLTPKTAARLDSSILAKRVVAHSYGENIFGKLLAQKPKETVLAQHTLDLTNRLPDSYGNNIFKENILLNVKYIGEVTLQPGQIFTFHDQLLKEYRDKDVLASSSKYSAKEGYKLFAGLYGNGVCHLASLMTWVAKDSGLDVLAPTRHDFYLVKGVPREYGTSIRYIPSGGAKTELQNLYITNNFDYPIKFIFNTSDTFVDFKIVKV